MMIAYTGRPCFAAMVCRRTQSMHWSMAGPKPSEDFPLYFFIIIMNFFFLVKPRLRVCVCVCVGCVRCVSFAMRIFMATTYGDLVFISISEPLENVGPC